MHHCVGCIKHLTQRTLNSLFFHRFINNRVLCPLLFSLSLWFEHIGTKTRQIHSPNIDICGCNGGSIIYVRTVKAARLSY